MSVELDNCMRGRSNAISPGACYETRVIQVVEYISAGFYFAVRFSVAVGKAPEGIQAVMAKYSETNQRLT